MDDVLQYMPCVLGLLRSICCKEQEFERDNHNARLPEEPTVGVTSEYSPTVFALRMQYIMRPEVEKPTIRSRATGNHSNFRPSIPECRRHLRVTPLLLLTLCCPDSPTKWEEARRSWLTRLRGRC